jgi:hypothetical protein
VAGNSEEVFQVVPIEHAALCDFAAPAGNLAAPYRPGEQLRLEATRME